MWLKTSFFLFIVRLGIATFTCNLPEKFKREISDHQSVVDEIIGSVKDSIYTGRTYNNLFQFLQKFTHRLPGTETLEEAINDTLHQLVNAGLGVTTQSFDITPWQREAEDAEILEPKREKISILGLINSGSTSGTIAPLIVITNFTELDEKRDRIPGTIVLFNGVSSNYETALSYQLEGPAMASKLGAVGALIRSPTNIAKTGPHGGFTIFRNKSTAIPAATIPIEEADKLAKLSRTNKLKISLKIEGKFAEKNVTTRNVIADLPGAVSNDEFVVLAGQIDGLDVGQGAMDTAGAYVALEAISLLKLLNLRPARRRIRAVIFSSEILGNLGSKVYKTERKDELNKWSFALESTLGITKNLGLILSANQMATCIISEILPLLKTLDTMTLLPSSTAGSSLRSFLNMGIPIGETFGPKNSYFQYHHSSNDVIEKIKNDELDRNVAFFAALSFVLANLSFPLPRGLPMTTMEYHHDWGKSLGTNLDVTLVGVLLGTLAVHYVAKILT